MLPTDAGAASLPGAVYGLYRIVEQALLPAHRTGIDHILVDR